MLEVKTEKLKVIAKNADIGGDKIKIANYRASNQCVLELIKYSKIAAPIKTGDLRRSITIQEVKADEDCVTFVYGSKLPYARIQDLGGFAGRRRTVFISGNRYLTGTFSAKFRALIPRYYIPAFERIDDGFSK